MCLLEVVKFYTILCVSYLPKFIVYNCAFIQREEYLEIFNL
jgi:hypothetical protein